MAYTVGTLTTQVQNKLDDSGYDTSVILQFLNDTQREIFNNYTLQFMESTATLNAASGNASAGTLPTNFQTPINLSIITPAAYAGLIPFVDYREVDAGYPTFTPNNVPSRWYSYADTVSLDPVPNLSYTLQLRYIKRATELTSDADVPEIPEEFQEVLVLGAFKRCLQVEDSYDQAAVIQINEYDPLVQRMVQRFSPRQQSGPRLIRVNRVQTRGYRN